MESIRKIPFDLTASNLDFKWFTRISCSSLKRNIFLKTMVTSEQLLKTSYLTRRNFIKKKERCPPVESESSPLFKESNVHLVILPICRQNPDMLLKFGKETLSWNLLRIRMTLKPPPQKKTAYLNRLIFLIRTLDRQ